MSQRIKMTMPVYKVSWILLLFIGFDRFDGISALCNRYERPSMPICVSGELSSGADQYIYLDTSGAPDFTQVKCQCDFVFSAGGDVVVRYRVENARLSNCFVQFKTVVPSVINWGCQSETNEIRVVPGTKTAIYTKNSSLISDWHACISITGSIGVTLRCYPYQLISEQEQDSSTTPFTDAIPKRLTTALNDVSTKLSTTAFNDVSPKLSATPFNDVSPKSSTTAFNDLSPKLSTTKQNPTEQITIIDTFMTPTESKRVPTDQQTANNAGPIVGGVIGSAVVVALIVAVVCFNIWRKKKGESSTGQGKRADFVAPLGKKGDNRQPPQPSNDNDTRVRTPRTPTALPTLPINQDQEDIHTYDFIVDKHVSIATVEPTMRQPMLPSKPADQMPVAPPREDADGYLETTGIGQIQFSSLEKTLSQDEHNYLGLHPTEASTDATVDVYLQLQ